ncbi:hypothetical protein E2C01_020939 [Portunus trituberculatus]|uniref:Uncharacterized protein n=1 Tax=Portunus trituberculatus TaxID=210409 RepID=A0A5B7E2Y0_PORTR|nr:hypothetical protein [Portunus trituberculatus]
MEKEQDGQWLGSGERREETISGEEREECEGKDKAGRTNLSHTVSQFLDLLLKVILPLSSLKREVGQVREEDKAGNTC